MKRRFLLIPAVLFITASFIGKSVQAIDGRYEENFKTGRYCDKLNTTCNWDSVAGELKLFPFEFSLTGSCGAPGSAYDVAVDGDYAFVADGPFGLKVIDISDLENPVLAGSCTGGGINAVAVEGDYAFLAGGKSGLQVKDISDPANPTLAGGLNLPGTTNDLTVAGNYIYISNLDFGLQVVDISDPANPVSVVTYSSLGEVTNGVAVDGDYAYTVGNNSGLQVVDISDPAHPVFVASYYMLGNTSCVAVDGDYAYAVNEHIGLVIFDISDPATPTALSEYSLPGIAYDIDIHGDLAFVANNISGLQVIDVSDPENPEHENSYDTDGQALGVAVAGDHTFIADGAGGLKVVRISMPLVPPILMSTSGIINSEGAIAVAGDYAFVAAWLGGLKVMDISDPENPQLAGSCATPGWAFQVDVVGNYAYIIDQGPVTGLQVIDITDPTDPKPAGAFLSDFTTTDVAISGNYAFITECGSGPHDSLRVLDISDPSDPVLKASHQLDGLPREIAIMGDYAFITTLHGVFVVDISDPTNPVSAGYYLATGNSWCITVSGNYAFVGENYPNSLRVLDISDPANPVLAALLDMPGWVRAVEIAGDYAYVACTYSGLRILDISNPASPTLVCMYDEPTTVTEITISGDYAYINSGFHIVKLFRRDHYDEERNLGRSLVLNESGDEISSVKLSTEQSGEITWELSANNGLNWEELEPDCGWHLLEYPGDALMWRSTHNYDYYQPDVNPTCFHLKIQWLMKYPVIESIEDVPHYERLLARITWARSILDEIGSSMPIVEYAVFREINIDPEYSALEYAEGENTTGPDPDTGNPHLTYPPGDWDFVMTVPADCEDSYTTVVPTLADITDPEGMYYISFFVRARTATPGIYFDSHPYSGYCADFLAPGTPQGLDGQGIDEELRITWNANGEADLSHYNIYRGVASAFVPGEENLLTTTPETFAIDPEWHSGTGLYYKLSAIDQSGNESGHALLTPGDIVATLLQSFSAAFRESFVEITWRLSEIDEGIVFFILRAGNGGFEELAHPEIEREGLSFTFRDRSCGPGISYRYRVEYSDEAGRVVLFETDPIMTPSMALTLFQNHPNPFNPSTEIRYYLPERSMVTLDIFDVAGRRVARLVDKEQAGGFQTASWNGLDGSGCTASSGVYFYMLRAGKERITRKMVLLR